MAGGHSVGHSGPVQYGRWYKYGVAFTIFQSALAVAQTIYAIYMGLSGAGGMGGGH